MTTKKRVPWLAIVAVLAGTIVFGLLLWKGPWWFDGAHLRTRDLEPADGVVITGFRTALVAVGVALTAAVGLIYTHRNHQATMGLLEHTRTKDREQAQLTRESQYADLYVDAIKMLAAKDSSDGSGLTERLGGIYALERVMRDSSKDHPMVVQILAAFVRQHAPRASLEVEGDLMPEDVTNLSDDVQAALTVLGRRPDRDGEEGVIDLSYTDLSRANLVNGRFERVNFSGTQLYGAKLAGTKLRGPCWEVLNLRRPSCLGRTFEGRISAVSVHSKSMFLRGSRWVSCSLPSLMGTRTCPKSWKRAHRYSTGSGKGLSRGSGAGCAEVVGGGHGGVHGGDLDPLARTGSVQDLAVAGVESDVVDEAGGV